MIGGWGSCRLSRMAGRIGRSTADGSLCARMHVDNSGEGEVNGSTRAGHTLTLERALAVLVFELVGINVAHSL